MPWHFPLHENKGITGASQKAELAFSQQYPSIYRHLLQHKEKLSVRNKEETGIRYEWYALQRCANTYYPEFEKEKVVYANMTSYPPFSYDNEGYYTNQKCFIVTGKWIKYLCGLLNSTVSLRWIRDNCPVLGKDGRELSKFAFGNIPLPAVTAGNRSVVAAIEALVHEIITAKQGHPEANTHDHEKQIDKHVYTLYGLTDSEIELIEGAER